VGPPERRIRVLLVEDNPGDARLAQESLPGDAFQIDWVQALSTALTRMGQGGLDVILLDLSLGDARGYDTFDSVKARAGRVPIIVFTSIYDEMLAMNLLNRGAAEYLVKGNLGPGSLQRAILRVLGIDVEAS
jgi:DNA-binding response OmpR family regulator